MTTLKQLKYAVAVADIGHFRRAAERCNVTQSALSQQVLMLEEECGTALFERTGKSVRTTPFGREYVERARAILNATDELEAFAAGAAGLPRRPIQFGLIPTVAPYLLPDIFPALRARFPELGFSISESRTDTLLKALAESSLDIALIASDPPSFGPRLTVEPLFSDSFLLATNAADADDGPVDLSDIAPGTMLLLDEGHCLRDQAIAACRLETNPNSKTFAATSLSTILEIVANGQGVTLLPEIALRKEATDPRIRVRPLSDPETGRLLRLVWRQSAPFADIFRSIAQTIRTTHKGARGESPTAIAPAPAGR